MNKKLYLAIAAILCALFGFNSNAQEDTPMPVGEPEKSALVDSITSDYYDWDKLSVTGKLSSPMLPMTASLKIYMEKGTLIVISVSAPFVGEAMRIEIDQQEVLIVNKMKNTYSTIDMVEMIEPVCPGGIDAIQNLLLGRVNILGSGELTAANSNLMDIYDTNPEAWILLPKQDLDNADYVYLYTVNRATMLLDTFAVLDETGNASAGCAYAWSNKKLTIDMEAALGKNGLLATLKLNNPDARPNAMERFRITPKYKKVTTGQVMKM